MIVEWSKEIKAAVQKLSDEVGKNPFGQTILGVVEDGRMANIELMPGAGFVRLQKEEDKLRVEVEAAPGFPVEILALTNPPVYDLLLQVEESGSSARLGFDLQ